MNYRQLQEDLDAHYKRDLYSGDSQVPRVRELLVALFRRIGRWGSLVAEEAFTPHPNNDFYAYTVTFNRYQVTFASSGSEARQDAYFSVSAKGFHIQYAQQPGQSREDFAEQAAARFVLLLETAELLPPVRRTLQMELSSFDVAQVLFDFAKHCYSQLQDDPQRLPSQVSGCTIFDANTGQPVQLPSRLCLVLHGKHLRALPPGAGAPWVGSTEEDVWVGLVEESS